MWLAQPKEVSFFELSERAYSLSQAHGGPLGKVLACWGYGAMASHDILSRHDTHVTKYERQIYLADHLR